jgi:hypothetical protein
MDKQCSCQVWPLLEQWLLEQIHHSSGLLLYPLSVPSSWIGMYSLLYNSTRYKSVFQYPTFILWEGINYQQATEDGICVFSPPFDDKIMVVKRN